MPTFEDACAWMKLPPPPGAPEQPNDVKLQFYGFFKQATIGDVQGSRPGMLSLNFEAKAKYDAWAKLKGMTPDEAKNKYVELLTAQNPGWENDERLKK